MELQGGEMKKISKAVHAKYSALETIYVGSGVKKSDLKMKKKLLSKPVKAVNLEKTRSISDLVTAFGGMSIQARRIGQCADVYESMLKDKGRPTVFLGIAGPLIAGGLRKVFRDMIAYGIVDVVVSTGAIMYQDLYQAVGYKHYVGSPEADDAVLRDLLINRIYDTYVDDEKFVEMDCWVGKFAESLEARPYSSREFLNLMGGRIKDENSILYTAHKHGVPIFCPAINDSSIGIGLTDHYYLRKKAKKEKLTIDSIRDNYELTQIMVKSKKTAAVYIAGGVPKNYINDAVVMGYIFGKISGGHSYAFQLTTDVPHWGGLSGSTLDEAKSWGKVNKKATRAMAFVEPTVSLPLVVGYVMQKGLWKGRPRLKMEWKDDVLKSLKQGKKVGVVK